MKPENLLKVADLIEKAAADPKAPVAFDMLTFSNTCGTAGCIAGFAVIAEKGLRAFWHPLDSISLTATRYLGLTVSEADALFYGDDLFLHDITPAMAVATLRRAARTGKIKWHRQRAKK